MNININFTHLEKIEFLESLGYTIEQRNEPKWEQWGNHDSQGNWIDKITTYVKKPKMSSIEYTLDKAFEIEMSDHLKNILLYAFKNK